MPARVAEIALLEIMEPHAAQRIEVVRLETQHHAPFIRSATAITRIEVQQREQAVRIDMRGMPLESAQAQAQRSFALAHATVSLREWQKRERRGIASNFLAPTLQLSRCRRFHLCVVLGQDLVQCHQRGERFIDHATAPTVR